MPFGTAHYLGGFDKAALIWRERRDLLWRPEFFR